MNIAFQGSGTPLQAIEPFHPQELFPPKLRTLTQPSLLWLSARDSDGAEEDVALTSFGSPIQLQVNVLLSFIQEGQSCCAIFEEPSGSTCNSLPDLKTWKSGQDRPQRHKELVHSARGIPG